MSTKERYGTIVWDALVEIASDAIVGYDVWASASAVGEKGGVSAMTARKYLDMLVETGHAECISFGGVKGYRVAVSMRGAQ